MKIHISEILPACDSELTLTNIGSHNVEHVISLIRQLVKITDVDRIENSTKNLLSQENIRVKEVNKYGKILDNKQDNEDKENNEDNEDTYHYQWQEGDWHYINTAQGKRYLRVRNLPALLEDTQFLKYANLIEITDSLLTLNGWEYKYGFFEGPFKIYANLSSPTSSKRAYRAVLEDGRVFPIKYVSDIQHILTDIGNSKIIVIDE